MRFRRGRKESIASDFVVSVAERGKQSDMITDTEIKAKGIETLIEALGELNAERFITLLLREPFDYTRWQRNLWTDKSVEEISTMAMQDRPSSDKLTG